MGPPKRRTDSVVASRDVMPDAKLPLLASSPASPAKRNHLHRIPRLTVHVPFPNKPFKPNAALRFARHAFVTKQSSLLKTSRWCCCLFGGRRSLAAAPLPEESGAGSGIRSRVGPTPSVWPAPVRSAAPIWPRFLPWWAISGPGARDAGRYTPSTVCTCIEIDLGGNRACDVRRSEGVGRAGKHHGPGAGGGGFGFVIASLG
ncbi:hypothetical protein G7046_g4322 [Stylonectria norvegica]|nr:hypothetical protein G7046_g4322 [Stylonectria norvegica]